MYIINIDCYENSRTLLEGAVRVPSHADRPELDEFSVEFEDASGSFGLLLFF